MFIYKFYGSSKRYLFYYRFHYNIIATVFSMFLFRVYITYFKTCGLKSAINPAHKYVKKNS